MRTTRRERRRADEGGAIAVIVALVSLVLFLVAGLVVDLGIARDTRRLSQNAADAAALAGVNALYPTGSDCTDGTPAPCVALAWQSARQYVADNLDLEDPDDLDWDSCPAPPTDYEVAPGSPSCISFDDLDEPSRMWVVVPTQEVHTGFGALAGVDTITISARARARVAVQGNYECGLCVVGAGPHKPGNGDITVSGGSVMFNGTYEQGNSSDNGHVIATSPGQIISVEQHKSGGGTFSPDLIVPGPHVEDPFAGLSFPLAGTEGFSGPLKTQPCKEGLKDKDDVPAQGPGVYGDVQLPKDTCTLEPGLYVILGEWSFSNKTDLTGTGVTLYATCRSKDTPQVCGPNGTGGKLAGKNGDMHLSAPTSGPLRGLTIVYDRENTAALDLQGNGNAVVNGTIYAPSATVDFPGNSSFTVNGGRLVAGRVSSNGNKASVTIHFQPGTDDVPRVLIPSLDQ